MVVLWGILEIFMTCIDTFFFFSIPAFQLGYQKWVTKKNAILYGLFSTIVITIYNYATQNSISVVFLSITLLVIYSIFFIQGKLLLKIFWFVFPIAVLHGIELSIFSFLIHVHQEITTDVFALHNSYRLQFLLLSKVLEMLLLVFLLRIKLHLNNFSYVMLLFITAGASLSILFMVFLELYNFTGKTKVENIFLNLSVAFVIINLCYLLLITLTNKQHKELLKQQKKLSEQQLQIQQKELQQLLDQKLQLQQVELELKSHQELAATHEKFKKFQMNVNENLQVLWSLAKMHKIPQFETYLRQFVQINQQFAHLCHTGNDVFDMVLASKEALANLHCIHLRAKVSLPPEDQFNAIDLGSILINLLDNAIEALQKLIPAEGTEKIIELSLVSRGDFYEIQVKNPCTGLEKRSQEDLASLSSTQNLGLGLKIVKELVDRYHGTLQITQADFFFTVLIQLPLKQKTFEKERASHAGKDLLTINLVHDEQRSDPPGR